MTDRDLARMLFAAGVSAADPSAAVRRALAEHDLPRPAGRTFVLALGKAAPAMLAEALEHIEADEALAVTHHENPAEVPGATVMRAGHPVPDSAGLAAAQAAAAMADRAQAGDLFLVLVSGGGSALLPAPVEGVSLADKQAVNRALLAAGLDIVAMNLVRQQLSTLKGGGLARRAAPAECVALILSDVIGDDLAAIASGPTVAPLGTRAEAARICQEAGIWPELPRSVRAHLSAEASALPTPDARNLLIGSNRQSVAAMAGAVPEGRTVVASDTALTGDVAEAARVITDAARSAAPGSVLLWGGETTVRLRGSGLGGRNQELALRVALDLADLDDWCFLAGGTDGRDGPTDAAGGLVDRGTVARIAAAGGDAEALLAQNDSNRALDLAGDLLITGATGTNVADLDILVRGLR